MRRPIRLLLTLTVALSGLAAPVRSQSPATLPSLEELREQIDVTWSADVAAWALYSFNRHVTRQSLDKSGQVTFRNEMEFRVTPSADGFDELLLRIDGRAPTAREVEEHRSAQRFTKHYGQAQELELNNPLGENLALASIIKRQEHKLVGLEEVDGVPCYRSTFDSRPEPQGVSSRQRLEYAVEGSACFSVEGYHLVEFEMTTVRPVKSRGIAVNFLQMSIEGQPVGDGTHWAPKRVAVRNDASIVGKKLRKSNSYQYSQFSYAPAD
jgi:hypothetical protein